MKISLIVILLRCRVLVLRTHKIEMATEEEQAKRENYRPKKQHLFCSKRAATKHGSILSEYDKKR